MAYLVPVMALLAVAAQPTQADMIIDDFTDSQDAIISHWCGIEGNRNYLPADDEEGWISVLGGYRQMELINVSGPENSTPSAVAYVPGGEDAYFSWSNAEGVVSTAVLLYNGDGNLAGGLLEADENLSAYPFIDVNIRSTDQNVNMTLELKDDEGGCWSVTKTNIAAGIQRYDMSAFSTAGVDLSNLDYVKLSLITPGGQSALGYEH